MEDETSREGLGLKGRFEGARALGLRNWRIGLKCEREGGGEERETKEAMKGNQAGDDWTLK